MVSFFQKDPTSEPTNRSNHNSCNLKCGLIFCCYLFNLLRWLLLVLCTVILIFLFFSPFFMHIFWNSVVWVETGAGLLLAAASLLSLVLCTWNLSTSAIWQGTLYTTTRWVSNSVFYHTSVFLYCFIINCIKGEVLSTLHSICILGSRYIFSYLYFCYQIDDFLK